MARRGIRLLTGAGWHGVGRFWPHVTLFLQWRQSFIRDSLLDKVGCMFWYLVCVKKSIPTAGRAFQTARGIVHQVWEWHSWSLVKHHNVRTRSQGSWWSLQIFPSISNHKIILNCKEMFLRYFMIVLWLMTQCLKFEIKKIQIPPFGMTVVSAIGIRNNARVTKIQRHRLDKILTMREVIDHN